MHLVHLGSSEAAMPSLMLIANAPPLLSSAEVWSQTFGEQFSLYVLDDTLPVASQIRSFVERLVEQVEDSNLKRLTVFGVGRGAAVAMELAVRRPKLVRRLLLLDAASRIRPRWELRLLDAVDEMLPLGLPFGTLSVKHDARPTLHLIRCPTLVMTSPGIDPYLAEQAKVLCRRIPNAWRCVLTQAPDLENPSHELLAIMREFLQVPVKRPQKNKD